ncbi:hypothetical protein AB0I60_17515 [Actinosynnema sp. NPDC050436]|uniref:hypothetical protein n=1 Tax=Actinosynnema sp. NPDC050436 TaxID=3155659 RepID=UPI0033DECED5
MLVARLVVNPPPAGPHGTRSAVEDRAPTSRTPVGGRYDLPARERAPDFRARCAAALLAAGPHAVLARETALVLHGCTAALGGALHVQVPYWAGAGRLAGVRVHRGRVGEVCEVTGLRCRPVAGALCDVLCRGDRYVALACADEVLGGLPPAGRVRLRAAVTAAVADRADPRGTRRALELLALATGKSPCRSRLLLTLVDAGLPTPAQHHPVPDGAGLRSADFAWPAARLALDYAPAHALRPTPPCDEPARAHASDPGVSGCRAAGGWTLLRAGPADLRNPAPLVSRLTRRLHAALRPGAPGLGRP